MFWETRNQIGAALLLHGSPHRLARQREYDRCRRAAMRMEQQEKQREQCCAFNDQCSSNKRREEIW